MTTQESTEILWDATENGYIPPERMTTTAPLHDEAAADVDPITYEVIRHALWNINIEHGQTILKVSGSPIALYSHDFNPAITTETGEMVYFGQYLQFLCAGAPSGVKWILENRDENPGINPGDIFLTNDPWISCNHQPDVVLLRPVFWEDSIFAWVTSTLHQYDFGGTTPGSFCPDAQNVFFEPQPIPPIKVVDGDVLRRDVDELFGRMSRLPDMVRLDLRAMIAGCQVAEKRILDLIQKYTAPIVKRAMRQVSDHAEEVFTSRLESIPDGTWRDRTYLEMALPGDTGIYEYQLELTKEGSELTFRNEGTGEQAGAMNSTVIGWKGAILTALIGPFLHDQLFAYGGPLRHLHFEPTPGTLSCAKYPAAVSCAPNTALITTLHQAATVVAKMIACSENPEIANEAAAKFGSTQTPMLSMAGTDQWGKPFATVLLDVVMAGIGGFAHRDGVSTGGFPFDPKAIVPNVEFNEQSYPILYLYRRELLDSAGAGRHRGGASASWAYVPHGTDQLALALSGSGLWAPTASGMAGGGFGNSVRLRMRKDSRISSAFDEKSIPQDWDDLGGEAVELEPKWTGLVQGSADVLEMRYPGAGGYGDPLERVPEAVVSDLLDGLISEGAAETIYGVVAARADDGERSVDVESTASRREELIRVRRASSNPARMRTATPKDLVGTAPIADIVRVEFEPDGTTFSCTKCKAVLGKNLLSYKEGCLSSDRPLEDLVPGFVPGSSDSDASKLIVREHFCPSCLRRLDAEVVVNSAESLIDVELHAPVQGLARRQGS